MADFADCIADDLPPISDEAFCNGFSGCGNPGGMRPTAENLNAVLHQIAVRGNNANLSMTVTGQTLALRSSGEIVATVDLPGGGGGGGGGGFDPGMIMMFSGLVAGIPVGWALCDGTNGTPDLRGKFVIGAGDAYAVGNQGGAEQHSHGPDGKTGGTALNAATMPAHRHLNFVAGTFSGPGGTRFNAPFEASNSGGDTEYSLDFSGIEPTVGRSSLPVDASSNPVAESGLPHDHTIANASNLPPYYALLFIMKLP